MAVGKDIQEFDLGDGATVLVEVSEIKGTGYQRISKKVGEKAPGFDEALEHIKPAAEKLLNAITDLVKEPQEVEIGFGIKFSAKLGAIIASSSAEGNFEVKITWVKNR